MADFDVIVIGGGGAGFSAAIAAREAGASVLVVEAADKAGGSTAMCSGVFFAAGTSVQRAAGVADDDADKLYHDLMALSQWRLEPGMIRAYADEAGPTLEWMISLGADIRAERLYFGGVGHAPRCHLVEGEGFELFQLIEQRASVLGIEVALGSRVRKLLTDGGGTVTGISFEGQDVSAKAVVMAAGGFGANRALLRKYFPTIARHEEKIFYFGNPYNRGDGLLMGQEIGAATAGYDIGGMFFPRPNFQMQELSSLPGWLVLVNELGRRFVNETVTYTKMDISVNSQPRGHCFAILDEETRAAAQIKMGNSHAQGEVMTTTHVWTGDAIAKGVEDGHVFKADTIAELAGLIGVPADALEGTVETYNRDVAGGVDTQFRKTWNPLRPIKTAPFYGCECHLSSFGSTGTGLRIDGTANVIDTAGRRISGLFAAGENAGGMYLDCVPASGSWLSPALSWGRIAGRSAAGHAGFVALS